MLRRALRVEITALVAAAALVVGAAPSVASPARSHPPGKPRGLIIGDGPTQLGITGTPRFSWQDVDLDPNATQTQYRIIVSSTPTTDPDDASIVWDSGPVESTQQTYVPYGGPPLAPDSTWYWSVRTSDDSGVAGPFADPRQIGRASCRERV